MSLKKVSVSTLLLLFLGGLVLVTYIHMQSRSTKIWWGKITQSVQTDSKQPSTSSLLGETRRGVIKPESSQPIGKRETTSSKSPHPSSAPGASPSQAAEEDKIEEIVVVKEGQIISSLAKEFYGMSNTTLIAFILDSNPEITDADFITVGQKIRVPKLTEESLIITDDHTYRIHVGTFMDLGFERLYRNEPILKGKEIEIRSRKVSRKDTWYSIVIGKFSDKDEALKTTEILKEKGLLPFFGGVPKEQM